MQDRNIGFELITLGHLLKRERDRANDNAKNRVLGEDNKVMCTDLGIIGFLASNNGKEVYQKDIERHFSLTAPSVSNKLRDLNKKGLVTRTYSEVDTRLKQVKLTQKAYDIDEIMKHDIEKFEQKIDELLSTRDKEYLVKVIDLLKDEFE